jgi:hypothetical protein
VSYDPSREIEIAKEFLGYHEGAANYNQFSAWQGLDPHNPWCASFTCYCAVGAGLLFPTYCTFGIKGEAYVPTMKQNAQRWGTWRERYWHSHPGDFVVYDWQNDGVLDHIEIVLADDGTNLVTIGGNVSDAVSYRTRSRANVGGFVALSESGQMYVPPKVMPMFSPPLFLVARLRNPDGGWWECYDNGTVDYLPDNSTVVTHGGMISPSDKAAFAGRHAAQLLPRKYGPGGKKNGFKIVAQSGEVYVPSGQR